MIDSWGFLIMAAGKGTRLGGLPKQFRSLGRKEVWRWSLDLARSLKVDQIVFVAPENWIESASIPPDVLAVGGGATRARSVLNGLEACSSDWVMIHDGARPFASAELCTKLMEAVSEDAGAIPVISINDAVKHLTNCGALEVVDRSSLLATQTPQVFHRLSLLNILKDSLDGVKDEAEPWIASGRRMVTVEGERINFKITTEEDWEMAQAIVAGKGTTRTGLGFDVHPLVPGRPLILGGVVFDSPLGLQGHSDADLVCHAISDGILGATGLPDIGRLFPASDESYRGADSYVLLQKSIDLALEKGWEVQWVDVVLHAQIPRIGGKVDAIVHKLNQAWGPESNVINLKVKSGEGVGAVGEAHCMTCYASVTARKSI